MTRRTRSQISLAVFAAAAFGVNFYATTSAHAANLVQWTFENLTFNPGTTTLNTATTTASLSGIAPDSNPGAISASASATHASATTVYSTPSGNGSNRSLSSNTWASGDYYEFDINSAGISGLGITFDQTGSNTGPRDFKIQTNNGAGWVDLAGATYALPTTTGAVTSAGTTTTGAVAWGTSPVSSTTFSFDLSSVPGLTGVRLVDADAISITGGAVGSGGTGRVDNVTFTGGTTAPEPASAGIIAAGAGFIVARRRRR